MQGAVSRSGRAVAVLQLVSTVVVLLLSPPAAAASREMSVDFHAASCPQLESIVFSSVQAALRREIALAAGLLRIFFHDCFPQGCDASVYLNATNPNTEQFVPGPNASLQPRALQLVEDIRAKVHAECGPTVSCADISALATRDAVVVSGGPSYTVTLGQQDSLAPASRDLVFDLPPPTTASVKELLQLFRNRSRGLGDPADLVALSGGHTVGRAHCPNVRRPVDADDAFSRKLDANCTANPTRLQELDVITPDDFDNAYYIALTTGQGVFTSDMALIKDPKTAPIVRQFAQDKAAFFKQFADSMVKLSKVPRLDDNNGEIRRNCFLSNSNGPRLDLVAAATDQDHGFAASASA